MNSSGIKRGLAAGAVAALAVTGLPFLASSASAAPGDSIAIGSVGPIRNANDDGGKVVLKTKGVDPTKLELAASSLAGTPNTPNQTVDIVGTPTIVANAATGDSDPKDGLDEITLYITATTPAANSPIAFAIFEDEGATPNGNVDAAEPRVQFTATTAGAPASVDISTRQPATAVGSPVSFSVEVKDAAGNLTQLLDGEEFDVTGSAGAGVPASTVLDDEDFVTGKASVTATPTAGGTQTVTVAGGNPPAATVNDSQSVTVYENATISADEFALNTGADTWEDGVTGFGGTTEVRVDQNQVTFVFAGKDLDATPGPEDAGKIVGLMLDSDDGVTFNGTNPATAPGGMVVVPVLLDAAGKGSTTVALGGVTADAEWTFAAPASSIGATTVQMTRAEADSVSADKPVYVSQVGGATAVTVTVNDQFGNPIGAPAQVSITRGTRNGSTTTARQTVDAAGKATFTLPDAGTAAGVEDLDLNLYSDQFDPTADTTTAAATINYTVDGQGADFTVTGATEVATATQIRPLNDSDTSDTDETGATAKADAATINIAGATAGTPATITVDNGALILTGSETNLNQGSASETITLTGGAGSFRVVGTKHGVVTVTIENGGRTKTVKLTVAPSAIASNVVATARNVAVEGPESAQAGDVAVFEVTVTDAFGNPVAGYDAGDLNITANGPGNVQSTDAATDANGVLRVNVLLTDNASSNVTLRVTGTAGQFGSKADEVNGTAALGLSASVNTASATIENVVNLRDLEEAVEEAQEAVDEAQDAVDAANDDLAVAKAERKVAQQEVKAAKKDLKKAKKQKKGVKAAQKALRAAKGDLTVAKAKVKSANNKVKRANADLADAQAELEAAEQALEDAQG